ncbi:GntR family transcriptional regulator [Paenibacillus antri]|nr:GntR family transcriptional regulator [Paenibacillus antri]
MQEELFARIRADDLAEKAYGRLKRAITMNAIQPGERIDMNALLERWGVSRTPLKDAVARLEAEGLVTVKPKVGTFATPITRQDMLELIRLRLLLEGGSCKEIAAHATEAHRKALRALLERLDEEMAKGADAFDFMRFNELDAAFHQTLVDAAGSRKLSEVYRSLNFHAQSARYNYDRFEERRALTKRDHYEMAEALERRDAERLEAVVRRHIASGKDRLLSEGE